MRKKNYLILPFFFLFAAPLSAYGQSPKNLGEVANLFLDLFQIFIPVIISLALLLFLWGVARFFMHQDNEQKRTEAKSLMIWGIIALAVMVSVWGLVQILLNTFGLSPVVPFFPPPR